VSFSWNLKSRYPFIEDSGFFALMRASIGQKELKERRKCPIEGLYWTGKVEGREDVSDMEGLLDKKR
jgi:hypothetical protein